MLWFHQIGCDAWNALDSVEMSICVCRQGCCNVGDRSQFSRVHVIHTDMKQVKVRGGVTVDTRPLGLTGQVPLINVVLKG